MPNKKIQNATPLEYDGIHFKSKLEVMAYKTLKEAGFPVEYEPYSFTIWEGFRPTVPFYDKDNKTKMLKQNDKKLINMKYTPDFLFEHSGHLIVIELKGLENDRFFIYKKLFRAWLEENQPNAVYFEIYSKKQLLQAIDIINDLKLIENGN